MRRGSLAKRRGGLELVAEPPVYDLVRFPHVMDRDRDVQVDGRTDDRKLAGDIPRKPETSIHEQSGVQAEPAIIMTDVYRSSHSNEGEGLKRLRQSEAEKMSSLIHAVRHGSVALPVRPCAHGSNLVRDQNLGVQDIVVTFDERERLVEVSHRKRQAEACHLGVPADAVIDLVPEALSPRGVEALGVPDIQPKTVLERGRDARLNNRRVVQDNATAERQVLAGHD